MRKGGMSEEAGTAEILRRLVAREGVPGGIPAMTPHRALRVAVNKAGQPVVAAGLRLTGFDEGMTSLSTFGDKLDPKAALFRLSSGPDCLGLLAVDAPIIHGIVAVRTTGALPGEGLPDRGVTKIDSVVAQAILSGVLVEFAGALEGLDAERYITGQKLGAFLADKRAALLELDDVPYRMFSGEVTVGDGAGTGRITFIIPGAAARMAQRINVNDAEWQRRIEANIMTSEAQLEARLEPMALDLNFLRNIKVGTDIPLQADTLNRIRVITLEGKTIATGRLGQMSGNRAVRIGTVRH